MVVTHSPPTYQDGRMSNITSSSLPRQVADAYVDDLLVLDPVLGTYLGAPGSARRLPDYSPAGADALAALARTTLERLTEAEARPEAAERGRAALRPAAA